MTITLYQLFHDYEQLMNSLREKITTLKLAQRGKTRQVLFMQQHCDAMQISMTALRNKIYGNRPFTFSEMKWLVDRYGKASDKLTIARQEFVQQHLSERILEVISAHTPEFHQYQNQYKRTKEPFFNHFTTIRRRENAVIESPWKWEEVKFLLHHFINQVNLTLAYKETAGKQPHLLIQPFTVKESSI